MYSPTRGYPLEQFEGSPMRIETSAQQYVDLGATMSETADALVEVSDSSVHRSMGTDALAEEAGAVVEDLRAASVRYAGTGEALLPYGEALRTARLWFLQNEEAVRTAETAYQQAIADRDSAAYGAGSSPDGADDHASAVAAADAAETTRTDLWTQYETVVETWETAYEAAADGVADAMDAADNDDGWWGAVSGFLTILGYVIVVLAIVAIFVAGSPLSWILVGLSALHFVGTVYLYANGKASLSDVVWSGVGLATAGLGAYLSRGGAALANTMDDVAAQTASQVGPRMSARHPRERAAVPERLERPHLHGARGRRRPLRDLHRRPPQDGALQSRDPRGWPPASSSLRALGSLAPGIVAWSTSAGVGLGSNQSWWPDFGRP